MGERKRGRREKRVRMMQTHTHTHKSQTHTVTFQLMLKSKFLWDMNSCNHPRIFNTSKHPRNANINTPTMHIPTYQPPQHNTSCVLFTEVIDHTNSVLQSILHKTLLSFVNIFTPTESWNIEYHICEGSKQTPHAA